MNKQEFDKVILKICALYPGRIEDKNSMAINWYDFFKDCDYESIMICVNNYAKENKFPPMVADIYGRYKDGIALIESRIMSGRNLINSIRSRYGCPDVWEDKYEQKIRALPVLKQYSAAQRIASSLSGSIEDCGIDNFSFDEWLGRFAV